MQAHYFSKRAIRVIFGLAAISATVAASAASVKYNFNVDPDILDWVKDSYGDTTKGVSLTRFDSSLGTLTGVTIHLDGSIKSDVQLANLSRSSSNDIFGTVSANFQLVEAANNYTVFDKTVSQTVGGTFGVNPSPLGGSATAHYDGVSGQEYANVTASGSWDLTSTDLFVLNYVTGTSPLSFVLSASDLSYTTDTAKNFEAHYDTLAQASGWIEYTYTKAPVNAVPAPPAMAAMVSGLSLAMRRRKKASK